MWPRAIISDNAGGSNKSATYTFVMAAGAAAVAGTSLWLYQVFKERGSLSSALNYIWEGDLDEARILEQAEVDRAVEESKISQMEEALERARLDSVDGAGGKEVLEKWISNYRQSGGGNLRTTLASMSDKCDKIAAKVDAVVLSLQSADPFVEQLKKKKKLLSKTIVLDMERCDALIASFQVLQEYKTQQQS